MKISDANSQRERGEQPAAQAELVAAVYTELRKLAGARMAREYGAQTLQGTALVHEAWLRLGGDQQPQWANRAQFFAAAAEAMRRILVERARRRHAVRHGGDMQRVDWEALNWEHVDGATAAANDDQIVALHETLEKLAAEDATSAELIKLRYFTGLSVNEAAEMMQMTVRTAERRLTFARAWLSREIERGESR